MILSHLIMDRLIEKAGVPLSHVDRPMSESLLEGHKVSGPLQESPAERMTKAMEREILDLC